MVNDKTAIIRKSTAQAEGNPDSFAHGLNFYKLFWIFFLFSLFGCGIEMLWCYITQGFIECRQGLIYGPFTPIYGLGAVVFTLLLYKIRKINSVFIFLASGVAGGVFEYLCSWAQQLIFGTVSWEYSASPFNLQGRTDLTYSICWGLLGVVYMKLTYPYISRLIEKIPNSFGRWITWIFTAFMIFDILVSASAVYRQGLRHENIPPRNSAEAFLDQHYTDAYLKRIYPNMQSVDK
jgi:uncharacterized membrane protein